MQRQLLLSLLTTWLLVANHVCSRAQQVQPSTPLDFILSSDTIPDRMAKGSRVGFFSATGAGGYVFSLVPGQGDEDNEWFTMDSARLKLARPSHARIKPALSIRVRCSDSVGQVLEKAFQFRVSPWRGTLLIQNGNGAALYFGELSNQIEANYHISLGAEYFFRPRFSIRTEAAWFRLQGSDANVSYGIDERQGRNLSFFSNNKELNVTATANLRPMAGRFDGRSFYNAYFFTGIGLMVMNPKTKLEGMTYELWRYQTEGVKYSRVQPALPLGIGIRLKIQQAWDLVFEAGYRFLWTDYLDDVSGVIRPDDPQQRGRYPDPATLMGGPNGISARLSDRRKEYDPNSNFPYTVGIRGNPANNDSYFFLKARVDIRLSKN